METDQAYSHKGEKAGSTQSMTEMLTIEEGTILVKTGRGAIESFLGSPGTPVRQSTNPRLLQSSGVFVSLLDAARERGLRGCIGNPFPEKPLLLQVAECAVEAATVDPRFSPVDLAELKDQVIVEVTVLTVPEEVKVSRSLEYRDKIVIGRDGLLVDGVGSRGLLLPQVAIDEGFDSEEFLSQCCLKAGLLPDAWLTGKVRVSRFQGQVFQKNDPEAQFQRGIRSNGG